MIVSTKNKLYFSIFQIVITIVIFVFLYKAFFRNYAQIYDYKFELNFYFLLMSFPFLFIGFPLSVHAWKITLEMLGENLKFKKCFELTSLCLLFKYLPGHFWSDLGKIYYCKSEGIPRTKTFVSIYIGQWLTITTGILLYLVSIFFDGGKIIFESVMIPKYLPLGFIIIIFFHPKVFVWCINFILQKSEKQKIEFKIDISGILELVVIYSILWILSGIGFNFLINSIFPIGFEKILLISGIFSISWVVGFIAFFAPMGLGVREGILSALLSFFIPSSIAIIIAVSARIWLIIPELIYGGIPLIKRVVLSYKNQ